MIQAPVTERSGCSRLQAEERPMPRYFFHLVKGSEIIAHDEAGQVCVNDYAAQQLAQRGDGLIWSRTLPSGLVKHYHIQVLNEAGQTIITVPLSKLKTA
jgi:hypothetical protein